MAYTRWNESGYYIQRISYYRTPDLEKQAAIISDLAGEIWRAHYTPIIGAEQVEYMLEKFQSAQQIYTDIRKNSHIYFIAKDTKNDNPIGYCGVVQEEGSVLLSKLYVRHDYRGKGVAKSFVDEIIALCNDYCPKIHLTVNKHNGGAIAAYKKMGFEIVGSVKKDIGSGFFMDDYMMELEVIKQ